jgi:hypothetical protein
MHTYPNLFPSAGEGHKATNSATGLLADLVAYKETADAARQAFFTKQEHNTCELVSPCPQAHRVPWLSILTSPCVWAIIVTHGASVFGYFTVVNQLPTYMKHILHFNIKAVRS